MCLTGMLLSSQKCLPVFLPNRINAVDIALHSISIFCKELYHDFSRRVFTFHISTYISNSFSEPMPSKQGWRFAYIHWKAGRHGHTTQDRIIEVKVHVILNSWQPPFRQGWKYRNALDLETFYSQLGIDTRRLWSDGPCQIGPAVASKAAVQEDVGRSVLIPPTPALLRGWK